MAAPLAVFNQPANWNTFKTDCLILHKNYVELNFFRKNPFIYWLIMVKWAHNIKGVKAAMYESYLGTIVAWAGAWVPKGWMLCDGRQLQIPQYTALYAIIGNRFGGDSVRTFALPKLSHAEAFIQYIICVEGLFPPRD